MPPDTSVSGASPGDEAPGDGADRRSAWPDDAKTGATAPDATRLPMARGTAGPTDVRAFSRAGGAEWWLGPMRLTRQDASVVRTCDAQHSNGPKTFAVRVSRSCEGQPRSGERNATRHVKLVIVEANEVTRFGETPSVVVSVALPRPSYPELHAIADSLGSAALDEPMAQLLGCYLHSLASSLPHVEDSHLPALEAATREVLLACLGPTRARPTVTGRPPQRERVEALIRANLGSARLNVGRLSGLSGISRSSLHRMFMADGGTAVFIRRLRLDLAHQMLADVALAAHPISNIAGECGFHSVPSFNRTFKAAFGCTPGEVRAQPPRGRPVPTSSGDAADPADPGTEPGPSAPFSAVSGNPADVGENYHGSPSRFARPYAPVRTASGADRR